MIPGNVIVKYTGIDGDISTFTFAAPRSVILNIEVAEESVILTENSISAEGVSENARIEAKFDNEIYPVIGSSFAKAQEAPCRGYHWGMAYPHSSLPRGTRIFVGTTGTLEQILFGPALTDDGSQNLMGAITTCMGTVGAENIKAFQLAEIIIAPSIQTEGKIFQQVQRVGMARK